MKQQFQLEQQRATLVHINPRPEKHGEENAPAADLKISINDTNGLLSMFHPTLRGTFYQQDSAEGQLEGVEALTVRRFGNLIERLRLDFSLKGADVVIGFGLGGGFGYFDGLCRCGFFCRDAHGRRHHRPDVPHQGAAQRRTDQEAVRNHGRRDRYQRDAGYREAGKFGLAYGR